MDKLIKTASILDTVFKIAGILLKVAFVACLVGLGIIAVGTLLDLPAEMIGYVDAQLQFGPLSLHVADGQLPAFDSMLIHIAVMIVAALVVLALMIQCVKHVRALLAPMKEGKPFASETSKNLRKLGWLSLAVCIAVQAMETISLFITAAMYRLDNLLISDKITHVGVNISFELSVLVIPAVFFLLAYIFKYGETLQTLSDETL